MKYYVFILIVLSFSNCQTNSKENTVSSSSPKSLSNTELISAVKQVINPKFKDWVLFENGSYLVYDNTDTIVNVKSHAIQLLKEMGPVHVGSPSGDFGVSILPDGGGWIISSHQYGLYTYVAPSEILSQEPSEIEIGNFGRKKRNEDGIEPVVIYINSK